MQAKHKSSALAMELCLSCTNPLIYYKQDTKVGGQILATNFGFVPDRWEESTDHWWIPLTKGQ